MIELLSGFPDNVLAVAGRAEVTGEDYRDVLIPAAQAKMRKHAHLRFYCELGADFTGFSPGAMWEDAAFGFSHWGDFGRMAVITDVAWVAQAMRMFAPFFHHPMRAFALKEIAAAKAWISKGED